MTCRRLTALNNFRKCAQRNSVYSPPAKSEYFIFRYLRFRRYGDDEGIFRRKISLEIYLIFFYIFYNASPCTKNSPSLSTLANPRAYIRSFNQSVNVCTKKYVESASKVQMPMPIEPKTESVMRNRAKIRYTGC